MCVAKASSEMSGQDQEASDNVATNLTPAVPATPAGAAFSLNGSLSHLLHRAQQAAADLHGVALGQDGLTQRQFAVLAVLAEQEGLSQSDLVSRTGIDRSTIAEMIARMQAKGLTQRTRSATDSRANSVSLTETGRAVYEAAVPKIAQVDTTVLAALPASKRAGFVELLMRLAIPAPENSPVTPADKKKKDKDKKKKKKKAKR